MLLADLGSLLRERFVFFGFLLYAFYESKRHWTEETTEHFTEILTQSLRLVWKGERDFNPRFSSDKLMSSRLVGLKDRSGKTRVVGICDMWSQALLRPLHDQIFRLLRHHYSMVDGTFDQDKMRKVIQEATKSNKILYSFDLTSATDRLPVWLQAYLG